MTREDTTAALSTSYDFEVHLECMAVPKLWRKRIAALWGYTRYYSRAQTNKGEVPVFL